MNNDATSCRLCGSRDIADIGAIPDSDFFAGRVLQAVLSGGRLYLCGSCGSMFRHPVLPSFQYAELYKNGNPAQWSAGAEREDLRHIRSLVAEFPVGSRILDVGCGSGDFLASLPEKFQKFGIDPSDGGAAAAGRKFEVIAREIRGLPAGILFDVVTMIDVIEHVVDPTSMLVEAYAHLRPEGKIIVSTGDPQNSLWRTLWKSKFWYVGFPEHLTFPSTRFWRTWCEQNEAAMSRHLRIRYYLPSLRRIALGFVMQAGFWISPAAFNWVGRVLVRLGALPASPRQTFSPGIPGLFLDHQIIVIEKPGA